MTKVLILIIKAYKLIISPHIGRHCRFHPSCSDYAREALEKHGIFTGLRMALCRILRCHPFSRGGYDPVDKEVNDIKIR
ncbi:MAG: membrane protein insertion efficiency factor YidD [Candidatus Omnitrophota bacterium]